MKKATVQVSFDSEKLGAIKQYMGKKDSELQTELDETMQKLYEKYVPAQVREYIDSRDSEPEDKPRKPAAAASHDSEAASGQQ
jgi:hypothetical protein